MSTTTTTTTMNRTSPKRTYADVVAGTNSSQKDTTPQPPDSKLERKQQTDSSTVNSNITLDDDEKLIFNLKILGTLQKHEKLTKRDNLLRVDDRYMQSIRRWYTGDNRHDICDTIFQNITSVGIRVKMLMDEDYRLRQSSKNGMIIRSQMTDIQKKYLEDLEKCRSKIQVFYLALSTARVGIENQRETYTDKFSQAKLSLTLDKLNATVEKLKMMSVTEHS